MYKTLFRSSAAAVACVASIVVLGLAPARAGTGSDRLVRLTRCGPQRTDAASVPTHPYEETAPIEFESGQIVNETSVDQQDSPVVPRRSTRSAAAAWCGPQVDTSAPVLDTTCTRAVSDHLPFEPARAPAAGRAPPVL
jgi:hypothetical protein